MSQVAEKLGEFVERFNRREYRQALDPVEDPWRADRNDFYMGLIRVVVALHQLESAGLIESPRFLLATAETLLTPFAPRHLGFDVAGLVEFVGQCREFVEERARVGAGVPAPPPSFGIDFRREATAGPIPAARPGWFRGLFRRSGRGRP